MIRWIGVFLLSCLALPTLFAQEPDVDQLGKQALRSLNAAADQLEAMAKNPPEAKVIEETKIRLAKEFDEIAGKIDKLPPAAKKAYEEKYEKEVNTAHERFKAAATKLNKDAAKPDAAKPESLDVIKKRIEENIDKAADGLDKTDPGKDTQEKQQKVSDDLKKFLEQNSPNGGGGGGGNDGANQNPPMPPMGKDPMGKDPMGKDPMGKDPMGKDPMGKDPMGKDPMGKDPMGKDPMGKDPMGKDSMGKDPKDGPKGGKPDNKGGKDGGGMGGKGSDSKLKNPDIKTGEWGDYPERQRQELDAYAREQFMRRYEEQLRQYYRAIAEQSRDDR